MPHLEVKGPANATKKDISWNNNTRGAWFLSPHLCNVKVDVPTSFMRELFFAEPKNWRQMRDYCRYLPRYDYSKWNLWRSMSKFQNMTQQHWLPLLYTCVTLVTTSLYMCWSQRASLCTTWLFSSPAVCKPWVAFFLKLAQLLMVDTCGDIETIMDPLWNEAITYHMAQSLKKKLTSLSKIPEIYGRKTDSSPVLILPTL